ncbi:DUF4197 domain-containing protein [Ferruginibacter yonginensis]|uniref:DUF4197 domain-containing protein n=1 Tax=Ferruginibacter yonginensis TaxID=1310416 RepID=A0ABV8QU51_9BACT
MKYIFTLLITSITLSSCDTLQQVVNTAGANGIGTGISNTEAAAGIKEALGQGITKSVLQLNTTDGFFKDALYKVLLPPEAKKIENTLRNLGFNSLVDKAILQINRGAEDAAGYAKPIFVDAIKSMTIADAIGLIRNGDTSATHFFREKTTQKLIAAFTPVIEASLQKTEATKYYGDLIMKYNNFPTTIKKLNPDLTNYVTLKATDALFNLIAKEEVNIRTNFAARTTDLLKKVFGGAYR